MADFKAYPFKVVPIGSSAFLHSLLVCFQTFLDNLLGNTVYVLMTYTYLCAPYHQNGFLSRNFLILETEKSYKNQDLGNRVGVPSLWCVLGVKSCFTDGTE
jgi:hypothetical protein